ncbi:MAG: substrate-binding domain-containing protein [Janthinobacterium lividum]
MDGIQAPANIRKAGLARYRRIEIDLRRQVNGGKWPVGAMLPSRRDLARQYAVSLVTLDRAIGPLLVDGTLRADDRRGTFVLKLSSELSDQETHRLLPALRDSFEQKIQVPAAGARPTPPVQSGSIGIITSLTLDGGQEYLILHELEQVLSHQGFSTTVLNRLQDVFHPRSLADAAQAIAQEDVSAVLVVCLDIDMALMAAELSRIKLGPVPMVCILSGELTLPIPHVFYDNRSGGHQAARHLHERGWQNVTVVAPFSASWVSERIAGVRDAAQGYGMPDSVQVLTGDDRIWERTDDPRPLGYQTARAALASGWRPSGGIICMNDGVAFGVIDAASEWGLEAGKDYAILGFDDEPDARTAGLTSVRPPMQAMAREAARLLLDHLHGADTGLQVRLRAHVIPRASTRRVGQ